MDNEDLENLRTACAWLALGQRVFWGTVVRTWGSAPRPLGSNLVLREDGQLAGSVSGGCIEDDLVAQARAGSISRLDPSLLRYGVQAEQAHRFGLPCGGTVEVLLEPVQAHSQLPELLQRTERGECTLRELNLHTGQVRLIEIVPGAPHVDAFTITEPYLRVVVGPRWRLILIGAGPIAASLTGMARALGYQVVVIDPRESYRDAWRDAVTPLLSAMPDDYLLQASLDAHCAVVALSHDPKLDDLALLEALRSPAFYVGAIGSKRNQVARRERLQEHFGLGDAELGRLHGPVGLDIGARTPAEIAVSIAAGVTAVRYGRN